MSEHTTTIEKDVPTVEAFDNETRVNTDCEYCNVHTIAPNMVRVELEGAAFWRSKEFELSSSPWRVYDVSHNGDVTFVREGE